MGAELGIIMLSDFGRRYELALLAQVVGATHTDEASFFEVIFLFKAQSDRVDEHREIMGIAADDLNEIVLPFNQGFVVDAAGVHLTEAVFASLGNEAPAIAGVLVVNLFLVFVTHRSAVDNDAGPFDRFFGLEAWLHAHVDKLVPTLLVDAKLRALAAGYDDLGAIGDKRCALVKRNFVDAELFSERRKYADKRFSDSSGSDDMYDFFMSHSRIRLYRF